MTLYVNTRPPDWFNLRSKVHWLSQFRRYLGGKVPGESFFCKLLCGRGYWPLILGAAALLDAWPLLAWLFKMFASLVISTTGHLDTAENRGYRSQEQKKKRYFEGCWSLGPHCIKLINSLGPKFSSQCHFHSVQLLKIPQFLFCRLVRLKTAPRGNFSHS